MKFTLSTEVGLLAIWDSRSLSHIDNLDEYRSNFVEDKDMVELMNKGSAVIWGTGGDGCFNVEVRINPAVELSDEEIAMVEMSVKNCKLEVTDDFVVVGSPECAGSVQKKCLEEKFAYAIDRITSGKYSVNVYFLYDIEAANLSDEMSGIEFQQYLENNPGFDKTGYVVILKKVEDDYVFPQINEFPQLG